MTTSGNGVHLYNWLALSYAIQHEECDAEEALRQIRVLAVKAGMRIVDLRAWTAVDSERENNYEQLQTSSRSY